MQNEFSIHKMTQSCIFFMQMLTGTDRYVICISPRRTKTCPKGWVVTTGLAFNLKTYNKFFLETLPQFCCNTNNTKIKKGFQNNLAGTLYNLGIKIKFVFRSFIKRLFDSSLLSGKIV